MKSSRLIPLYLLSGFCWLTYAGVLQAGIVFSNVYSFDGTNAALPVSSLAQGPDGSLYGVTQSGGSGRLGTVFQMTPDGLLTFLVGFQGPNGSRPTSLLLASDGNLYGTTYQGGSDNLGTIFQLTTNGSLTSLASFTGTNGPVPGAHPLGRLTPGGDGNLYGTTSAGGAYNLGTVFRFASDGSFATVLSFDATNGADPEGELFLGTDGNFYGTTRLGGTHSSPSTIYSSKGTIFRMTLAGDINTLVSFDGTNGALPQGGLTADGKGNLYGTTAGPAWGTVFRLSTTGNLDRLAAYVCETNTFGDPISVNPVGDLILASDGNLYGATSGGGTNENGTLFEVTPEGVLTILYEFGGATGLRPAAGLLQAVNGAFYGTTQAGGLYGKGNIFRLSVPLPPLLEQVVQNNGAITLTWTSVVGENYELQSSTDLSSAGWLIVGLPVQASSGSVTVSEPLTSVPARFYRISVLP